MMNTQKIIVGQIDTNCYIISDEKTAAAIVIDPGDEYERIMEKIDAGKLRPKYILFTHSHYDHVCAARELKDTYGALIAMHADEKPIYENTKNLCMSWGYEADDFPPPDILLKDNDTLEIGRTVFRIVHTPGHSPGSICVYSGTTLFTGDTLFSGSAGRTDLKGGNAGQLLTSLEKIATFPPGTIILCGHGEDTTVAREIRTNPFITPV